MAASFQRDADLGDHGFGGVELVALELEPGQLDQGGRILGLFADREQQRSGLLEVLERLGLDLGSHHDQRGVIGLADEELGQDAVGLGRACRAW